MCWKLTTTPRILFSQLLLTILLLTQPVSICVSLMGKIKIYLLTKNASCNGTFDLDTVISLTPILLFDHSLLEHINFSHIVLFPFRNVPSVKSSSMQKLIARLFMEIKHILTSLVKDLSVTIIFALVLVCMWIIFSPDPKRVTILTLLVSILNIL